MLEEKLGSFGLDFRCRCYVTCDSVISALEQVIFFVCEKNRTWNDSSSGGCVCVVVIGVDGRGEDVCVVGEGEDGDV